VSPSSTLRFSSAAFFSSSQAWRCGPALPAEPVEVPARGIIVVGYAGAGSWGLDRKKLMAWKGEGLEIMTAEVLARFLGCLSVWLFWLEVAEVIES